MILWKHDQGIGPTENILILQQWFINEVLFTERNLSPTDLLDVWLPKVSENKENMRGTFKKQARNVQNCSIIKIVKSTHLIPIEYKVSIQSWQWCFI